MRRALLTAAFIVLPAGCYLGPRVASFAPARAPEGVGVEVSVATASAQGVRTEVSGELLEVRGEGLLVLGALVEVSLEGERRFTMQRSGPRKKYVVLVPFDHVLEGRFAELGSCCNLDDRWTPTEAVRDRLRLVSRFPQGLAPDLLRQILDAQDQPEVRKLGP